MSGTGETHRYTYDIKRGRILDGKNRSISIFDHCSCYCHTDNHLLAAGVLRHVFATNQSELVSAVASARTNGEDDAIILSAGTFQGSDLVMNENHALTIQGAGAGRTIITPHDMAPFGFQYGTISGNDSVAHFILRGVTLTGGTGSFTSQLGGLEIYTLYHVRAYATNSAGTAYGEDISFTTNLCPVDVMMVGTPYMTLQEAVNGGGGEVAAVARVFRENILFSCDGALTIHGGYNCELNADNGVTTINGTMTIAGTAAVTLGNVAVY
jgi:hypothetical protein